MNKMMWTIGTVMMCVFGGMNMAYAATVTCYNTCYPYFSNYVGTVTLDLQCNASSPASYTGYLTVNGASLSYNKTCVVAPTVSLSANPSSIAYNGSTTLQWSAANASSCWASGGWTGWKSVSGGTAPVGPLTTSTNYSLECWNNLGTSSGKRTILVTVAPKPPECTGNITTTNAAPCAGDETGLSVSTNRTLVNRCGPAKCEFVCNSGFVNNNGVCKSTAVSSCTGADPSNAMLCAGSNVGLTVNTAKKVVSSCTGAKCEFVCNSGFVNNNGVCQVVTYPCTGSKPSNAVVCPNDNQLPTENNVAWSEVSNKNLCTPKKCEYYLKNNVTTPVEDDESSSVLIESQP